jgi:glucokinase
MRKIGVGVDLGATNVRIAVGDEEGNILCKLKERTIKDKGAKGISEQIIGMIHNLKPETNWIKNLLGIGIGSTGPLDLNLGGLMKPTNIPYDYVPLVAPLKQAFKKPIHLLNDGQSAVIGEKFFGAGKKHENLGYITLGSGIGGGIYVDDHLIRGKDGNATEIGHFTIDFKGQLLCGCGRRGHWEAYCSGLGIPNYARLLLSDFIKNDPKEVNSSQLVKNVNGDWRKITTKMIFDCAKLDDKISKAIVEKVGTINAIGFSCVIDAYDPSLITVGGSLALKNESLIMEPIKRNVVKHSRNGIPEIHVTEVGDEIVLYGALALAFNKVNA